MKQMMNRVVAAALAAAFGLTAGCSSRPVTSTPRSAIEQMLLSGAVDRALEKFYLRELVGRKVYIDFTNLSCYDVEYVRLATRARFARMRAVLVDKAEDADYVVEVASGALGTELKTDVVGLPALPVPNSPAATPEMTAYSSGEQTGIVKLLVLVHRKGRLVGTAHCYAKCDREESFAFGHRFEQEDEIRQAWDEADVDLIDDQTPERRD
ncbi:MAG: DUF6655 family protein [Planctomycetota bacterium]